MRSIAHIRHQRKESLKKRSWRSPGLLEVGPELLEVEPELLEVEPGLPEVGQGFLAMLFLYTMGIGKTSSLLAA